MPILKDIKISQEINFNGLPTWVSIGGDLLENEDPKEALRKIQKIITEYHQEEQKAYSQSKWGSKTDNTQSEEIKAILDGIEACTYIKEGDKGEFNLSTFWLPSKGNLVLSTAYKAKEKQLTDAK